MSKNRKTSSLLPSYLQTDKNKKFLSNTLDEFLQPAELERVDGFIGTKSVSNYDPTSDTYLQSSNKQRNDYQLEPGLVFKSNDYEIKKVVFYDDIINQIKAEGGFNDNIDQVFNSTIYPFDPPIDWDKLVNYDQYFWLPNGPDPISIGTDTIANMVGQSSFIMRSGFPLSNGMKLIFDKNLSTTGTSIFSNTEYIVEGVGNSIQLVDFGKLAPPPQLCTVINEAYDSTNFDRFGFDTDGSFPDTPDYITINKASNDLNPWTRYNRWFHKSVITATAAINTVTSVSLNNNYKAKRPIIEFRPNLRLFNFGINGQKNIDLIDTTTTNPLDNITGTLGYYIDEILLEQNYRIIFNNDDNINNRKKVYKVIFTNSSTINLQVDTSYNINNGDSISINYGKNNGGESFYYDDNSGIWLKSQNHTKHNQAPLFDIFDENLTSLKDLTDENNFSGSKIFGYDEGQGTNDVVLGFPIKYNQNFVGISGITFRNYFSTDSYNFVKDRITSTSNIDNNFYKFSSTGTYTLANSFSQPISYRTPINQNFLISNATSTVYFTAIDTPISGDVTVTTKVNNKKKFSNYLVTTSSFEISFLSPLSENDFVSVSVITTQTSNSLGTYKTIPSLTNNPLNEKIATFTYSQLLDYVGTMVDKIGLFKGDYPGDSNLRDFYNLSSFGDSLISNENLITFVELFLGNKDNNIIDSFSWVAEQYNQFKQNFIRNTISYSNVNDTRSAVDDILTEMFKNKLLTDSFYNSDMAGYGDSKIVKSFTILTTSTNELPLIDNFDLTRLSFQSVLVYQNNNQLIYGQDYEFDYDQASVKLSVNLNVNDVIDVYHFDNTAGCYIPPTPTKHGLYFKWIPEIISDARYLGSPQRMIRCHDGSMIKAFNDYRDNIILELERRIYNNIKTNYSKAIFDIWEKIPGAFRKNRYTKQQFNSILEKDFSLWTVKNGVDATTNTSSSLNNEKSWNYVDVIDKASGTVLNGTYRSIYNYLYDTDRPDTHPWEMLGFTVKPTWWNDTYGTVYNFFNNQLWTDVLTGNIAYPSGKEYDPSFSRIGGATPVTPTGQLVRVLDLCYIYENSLSKTSDWEFGDYGPAEVAWRNSSYYPFSLQKVFTILYPLEYLSKLFDISRVKENIIGQIVWKEDNLFLSPRKLLVEGYNTDQISGFGNFLLEYGSYKSKNYRENFAKSLQNLDMNLVYKLGAYTTQDKIQLKINAVDPDSTSPGLVLPKEDYQIKLNVSNAVEVLDISGIIIQKVGDNRYSVKGYNRKKLWFTIQKPILTRTATSIQVGGRPEKYSVWSPNLGDEVTGLNRSDLITASSYSQKFYKQGQIVKYDEKFYRVKVSHSAGKEFNDQYFTRLAQLPYSGGAKVLSSNQFESIETEIPYGTVFSSVQDVYNFIIGYGKYLETKGFVFDNYNQDLSAILDWRYSGQEFLFWSTQNWAVGNLITLSPFVDYIKFYRNNYVVDDIFSNRYEYSLQNADGLAFSKQNIDVSREDNEFTLKTVNTEEGIYFASLALIQKEHIFVLNNTTIFNDTIFEKSSGYRQKRIRLSGFITKNWNGDVSSPGFLFYKNNVTDWESYKSYLIGDVVKYNTNYYQSNRNNQGTEKFNFDQWTKISNNYSDALLPNFDYKINQFEDFYSLDIDNFDVSQQRLAQHLTGYTPRNYLNKIITDPIAQYKFYQGFIKDKGTKKVLSSILKANKNRDNTNIELLEEWAVRLGEYGSYSSYKEVEFILKESRSLENPYLVKLTDSKFYDPKNLINYTSSTDILIKPLEFDIENVFATTTGTFEKNNLALISAGYVREDDVTATAYNKNSILDIANNGILKNGDTLWTGFLENGDWTVYRYYKQRAKITGVYVSSPGSALTFVTSLHHNLSINDIISVVNFNKQVNGVYIVTDIPDLSQFTVASSIAGISNEPLLSFGSLFKLENARFTNYQQWSLVKDQLNLQNGSKVWIDKDEYDKWIVFEKINNYDIALEYKNGISPTRQKFGTSIWANENSNVVLVSAPQFHIPQSLNYGKVKYYQKNASNIQALFDIELNYKNNYALNTTTDFGFSLAYDINKNLIIIGSPGSTSVRASSSSSVLIPVSSSTIIPSRGLIDEGLVKITTKNNRNNGESTKVVFAQPFVDSATLQNSRFGHSLYISQVELSTSTILLVGAPGNAAYTGTGTVHAYKINLLNVDKLDFDLDEFVNLYKNDYSFTDYKDRTLTILPYFVSNNLYVINGVDRFGLYRDPSYAEMSSIVDFCLANGIIGQTPEANSAFFINLVDTNYFNNNFDYDRSRTENKLYQKIGTIDLRTFFTNTTQLLSTSSVILNVGARWGQNISGDNAGTNIAISAPNYYSNGVKGIVQIFNKNLQWKQSIDSPFGNNDEFGSALKISSTGKFLFVASQESYISLGTYGKVAVYLNTENGYVLSQILENPILNSDLKFGKAIDISQNEKTLVISSIGTNRSEVVKFYLSTVSKKGETTFDNGQTRFITTIYGSGSVYTYQNFNNYFVQADELLPVDLETNGKFGSSIAATDKNIFIGAPSVDNIEVPKDLSRLYQFKVLESTAQTWNKIRYQEDLVDVSKIYKVSLIDNDQEKVLEYLDIFDPIKGKIPGIADQEIKFKAAADPAIYSIGLAGTTNDTTKNWLDDHIGELWWDLSTAKYVWYEQGNEVYRKNNWGKLFPGSSIDIYEWVRSTLTPSEWATQADTSSGLAKGISGQPKYPDNSVISVKQVLNTVTGAFENVYFFWVKNKTIVPDIANRRKSALEVARLISDPLSNGLRFVQVLTNNALTIGNVQTLLKGSDISLNVVYDEINNQIPLHTEWLLMREGDSQSIPPALIEKKLIDSLVGLDDFGNTVPDVTLTFKNRYGTAIRPRQTLFKDRFLAIKNLFDFVNEKLSRNRIYGIANFENLNAAEPIPAEFEREYDFIVADRDILDLVETATLRQAKISCSVKNGTIINVSITDPGFGYKLPPKIVVTPNPDNSTVLQSYINDDGRLTKVEIVQSARSYETAPKLEVRSHTVLIQIDIESSNRWSLNSFDYINKLWIKTRTQLYNTPLYWDYIDYEKENFDKFKGFSYIVPDLYSTYKLTNVQEGNYILVLNIGNGRKAVLEKTYDNEQGNFSVDYNIVYNERGTIRFNDSLWNTKLTDYGFDKSSLDQTLYDQLPDIELKYILTALKDDIFINDLKVNWNLFFFIAIRYALSEQRFIDWAFKTSFVIVKNQINFLDTPSAYRLDSSEYYEDFIKEVKPYRTKVRNFISVNPYIENTNIYTTDFDVPPVYDTLTGEFIGKVSFADSVNDPTFNQYPYKSWTDNRLFYVKEIVIANPGSGYIYAPNVFIDGGSTTLLNPTNRAKAEAYIRNGQVYKIVVTNPGSGYEKNPSIRFVGGFPASTATYTASATASVVLGNNTTRANTIGIKFDRISKNSDLEVLEVDYTFPDACDGSQIEFVLPYRADSNKQYIFPTLDKKLVLGENYKIVEFKEKINSSTFIKSKFVFINLVPKQGQIFRVVFQKHISLYNAIDRINKFYTPNESMVGKNLPLLMKGLEYPFNQLQGLQFDYSTPLAESNYPPSLPANWTTFTGAQKITWLNDNNVKPFVLRSVGVSEADLIYIAQNGYKYSAEILNGIRKQSNIIGPYGNGGGWNDFVSNYTRAKVVSTATTSTTTIYLNTVKGIIPGQNINFLNTSTSRFRTDTVVTSVNTAGSFITISSPRYNIYKTYTTGTSIGSYIQIDTTADFHGDIREGDEVEISGITTGGYNGFYEVFNLNGKNSFIVTATNVLADTTSTFSSATVRVLSILSPITAKNKVIGQYNFYVGPCLFPEFTVTPSSPSIQESFTATFSIDVVDIQQVDFGLGRTFGYRLVDSTNNIVAADFNPSSLDQIVTTTALSLPIQFDITMVTDPVAYPLPVKLELYSYVSTATVDYTTVASTVFTIVPLPGGAASYAFNPYDSSGNIATSANEGETVTYKASGTNVIFGGYGRTFRYTGSGPGITSSDIGTTTLVSPDVVIYNESQFSNLDLALTFANDYLAESSESFSVTLETWLNVLEPGPTYTTTNTIVILDAEGATPTYSLTSNSPVYEGSTVTITLVTTNKAVGQNVDFTVTNISGTTFPSLAKLNTATYTGTFVLVSGGFGQQISTFTYTLATGGVVESNQAFRLKLIDDPTRYVDVTISDQIVSEFGQVPSTIYSRTNQSPAFARLEIETAGTFTITTATTNAIFPSGYNVTPAIQTWARSSTGVTGYYVRATVDPFATWVNFVTFSGPGFATALTPSYFNTNGYAPVVGNWVQITTAAASSWEAVATYDTNGVSSAAFYLTIEISVLSGGPTIASGVYSVFVESSASAAPVIPPVLQLGTGGIGGCIDPNTGILVSPNQSKLAAHLAQGDIIYTMHEITKEFGYFAISHYELIQQPKLLIKLSDLSEIFVSTTHRFYLGSDNWEFAKNLVQGDKVYSMGGLLDIISIEYKGVGEVIKLEVEEAHTYVANNIISHNVKNELQ